jgi:hypothetical protein
MVIAAATLIGPIAAVQAQKWVERWRDARVQKQRLFATLMATRGARLSDQHVYALNSIDLTFAGRRAVTDAWREYLDRLNAPQGHDEAQWRAWHERAQDKLVDLLYAMAADLGEGATFDRTAIRNGAYVPTAHGAREQMSNEVLIAARDMLTGRSEMKMRVTNILPPEQRPAPNSVPVVPPGKPD